MTVFPVNSETIVETSDLIARGRASPADILATCLSRIDKWEPRLRAFTCLRRQATVAEANAAGAEPEKGIRRGPLHGIPIAVKDVIDVEGLATSANSRSGNASPAEMDATVVERLRARGAIILGKTTTWEYAIGETSEEGRFARARNPHDTTRETGGSSSGSAVAVAAGEALAALGTDTGGSIRCPASWCGVVGFKPTHGATPLKGVLPLAPSLDCVGVLARSTVDTFILFEAMTARRDDGGQFAKRVFVTSKNVLPLKGFRIAIWPEAMTASAGLAQDVRDNFAATIARLESAGATIGEVDLPALEAFNAACFLVARNESFECYREQLADPCWRSRLGAPARARLLMGGMLSAGEVGRALELRGRLTEAAKRAMTMFDAVATPAMHRTAPRVNNGAGVMGSTSPLFIRFASLTGQPSITVPCGSSNDGMPFGLLLNGRHSGDQGLLFLAALVEGVLTRDVGAAQAPQDAVR